MGLDESTKGCADQDRKVYEAPRLTKYGNFESLTQADDPIADLLAALNNKAVTSIQLR